MATYLPSHTKKRDALAKLEAEFGAMLENNVQVALLVVAAEGLRMAHIRALRATRGSLRPAGKSDVAYRNLDREVNYWQRLPGEQIIEGYRAAKLQGRRRGTVRRAAR